MGKSDYLEPLTKDFPQFGKGGATQAIFGKTIQIDKVVDLRSDKVIFQRVPR